MSAWNYPGCCSDCPRITSDYSTSGFHFSVRLLSQHTSKYYYCWKLVQILKELMISPLLTKTFLLLTDIRAICCLLKQYSQCNCLDLSLKIRQVLLKLLYGNSGKKGIRFILRSSTNINIYIIEMKLWRNNNYHYSMWSRLPFSFPFHSILFLFILWYSILSWDNRFGKLFGRVH